MTVSGTVRINVTAQNNAKAALDAAKRDMEALAAAARKAEDDAAKTDAQRAALKEKRARAAAAEALRDAQHNADAIAKINEKADEEDRKRAEERAKADEKMYADLRRHAEQLAKDMHERGARAGRAFSSAMAGGLKVGGGFAKIGEAALLMTPSLIAAGDAVVKFAKSAGAAAPALLAMGAAALFAKMTIGAIAPAIERHMKPIADAFDVATAKASFWATRGIRPLAAEWAKAGMPIVSRDMSSIAATTNGVVKGFLEWGKSTAGLKALGEFTSATARGMARLGPSVQGVAISFGNMLGRISNVSIAAGSNGLSGVLDKLNGKLDAITEESVQAGLDRLKEAFRTVKNAVDTVKNAVAEGIEFWFKYQEQIGYVRDALSVLAIAFGGPLGILVGGASLITRHWDKIKPVIDDVKEAFDNLDTSDVQGAMDRLGGAVEFLKGEWQDLVSWFKGTLWPLIKDELPAIWENAKGALNDVMAAWDDNKESIGEWYRLTKELAKFVAEHLVPVLGTHLANTFKAIGQVISVAITGFGLFARAIVLMVRTSITVMEPMIDVAILAARALGMEGTAKKLQGVANTIDRVKNALNAIPTKKNIEITIRTREFVTKYGRESGPGDGTGRTGGFAHGGIVGAATGGIHGGLRWVGEQGPELVNMAPGSTVHSAGDSARMASGSGGGNGRIRMEASLAPGSSDQRLMSMLVEQLRYVVWVEGAGNVQAALGRG